VVRDLQDVDAQVRSSREQRLLRRLLDVAGQ
jgi:hypothetical protein